MPRSKLHRQHLKEGSGPVAVSRAERGARVEEDLQNIRAFEVYYTNS